jgi:hypothetical protein
MMSPAAALLIAARKEPAGAGKASAVVVTVMTAAWAVRAERRQNAGTSALKKCRGTLMKSGNYDEIGPF